MIPSLTDDEIIRDVKLSRTVPEFLNEAAKAFVQKFLRVTENSKSMTGRVAVWPDGAWAAIGQNPDWSSPRHKQLIRTYRSARFALEYNQMAAFNCNPSIEGGSES